MGLLIRLLNKSRLRADRIIRASACLARCVHVSDLPKKNRNVILTNLAVSDATTGCRQLLPVEDGTVVQDAQDSPAYPDLDSLDRPSPARIVISIDRMTDEDFERHAFAILKREPGLDGFGRFLRLNRATGSDYTHGRDLWLHGTTINGIMTEIDNLHDI